MISFSLPPWVKTILQKPLNIKQLSVSDLDDLKHKLAKFSPENPLEVGESTNPLGAGVAACIGASNIFRYVFCSEI